MEVYALHEGSYSVGVDKIFIPFDPAIDDKKDRKGSLFIHVQPFLVKRGGDLIVIDTGLGQEKDGELAIHRNIREQGFEPGDVNLVLMSHLHQDHASGMLYQKEGKWELTFPNAEYVIQRSEWEEAYTNRASSNRTELLDALQRSGQIHFVEGDGTLNEYIRYEMSSAHSRFHQVFYLEDGGKTYFFGGDEWPEPEQALRKFAAKYDYDGKKAMELREEYASRAADEQWICLFYHAKADAISGVRRHEDSFKIVAV